MGQILYAESELLLQVYTDDPWSVVAGTLQEREDEIACILSLWMVLGLGVAYHKAVRGQDVVWIGIRYILRPSGVDVSVNPDLLDEVTQSIDKML